MRVSPRVVALLITSFLCLPAAAFAQASVAGSVRDASGGVLPGVTVEAASPALIEKVRSVVTDGTGQFQIIDLRPGTYSLTFTLPGFSTFKREGIELSGTFSATVNAEMRVGAVEETITVTGEAPVVDIRTVKTQTVLDDEVISAIPTGRNYQNLHVLVPGVTIAAGNQDVGGSKGDQQVNFAAHGGDIRDSRTQVNGMIVQDAAGGGGRSMYVPHAGSSEEVSITTSGGLGEVETSGVFVNIISKDGGNTYSGVFFATGATEGMVGSNYTQELKDLGLRADNKTKSVYDLELTYGGPLLKDRLWFFADVRQNGNSNTVAGMFVNKNAGDHTKWTYDPDFNQQVVADNVWKAASLRLTFQATTKHKFTVSYEDQLRCVGCKGSGTPTATPEATGRGASHPNNLGQATWTAPMTDRVLLEAGFSAKNLRWGSRPFEGQENPELIRITEQAGIIPGLVYRAPPTSMHKGWYGTYPTRAAMSYTSGSHSMKFGYGGVLFVNETTAGSYTGLAYRFRDGVPNQLTQSAHNYEYRHHTFQYGLYAQDQWTVNRLTVAGGLRYDRYTTHYPEAQIGPVRFVPVPLTFPEQDGFSMHDVTVRSSAAYDLFGNGKTAVKMSLGKYLTAQDWNQALLGSAFGAPAGRVGLSASRSWNDADRDYVPDCDLLNLTANGECGAASDQTFGKPVFNRAYDPALKGWGVRPYNWSFDLGIQRELLPRVSMSATYFRRWFGNPLVVINRAVTANDYTFFDLPLPADPRLPIAGAVRGFSDVNPTKFGQVDNYVTSANTFGKQTQSWHGTDITLNARFAQGIVQGGLSTGRDTRDNCEVVAKSPTSTPTQYCHVDGKLQTQIKLLGAYEVPRIAVQVAATLQNIPGEEIVATYAAPNAVVAPLLGRSLSGAAANTTLNLLPPLQYFSPRFTQLDLRFSKIVRMGGDRLLMSVDLFNALNSNAVQTYNGVYNPTGAWRTPLTILSPRFVKVSGQLDF